MKLLITSLILIFLISCSPTPSENTNANAKAKLAEKNKETATRNEMIRLVQEAQKLEQEGREMEFYRKSQISIESGACAKALEKKAAGIAEFQRKMEEMPENYKSKLELIFADLSKCFACEKKAIESCKKARATINQVIKEVFPQ